MKSILKAYGNLPRNKELDTLVRELMGAKDKKESWE